MLQYIKDTQYDIHNMEYVCYPNLKGMNVSLYKHIKVYKLLLK